MAKRTSTAKKGAGKKAPKNSASADAGEYVRKEIEAVRKGEHGARSAKQIIAIGLSKARRAGVDLPPPKKGKAGESVRKKAKSDLKKGKATKKKQVNRRRSQATLKALQKEGHEAASHEALSRQSKKAAKKRTASERSRAAKKAARTRRSRK